MLLLGPPNPVEQLPPKNLAKIGQNNVGLSASLRASTNMSPKDKEVHPGMQQYPALWHCLLLLRILHIRSLTLTNKAYVYVKLINENGPEQFLHRAWKTALFWEAQHPFLLLISFR